MFWELENIKVERIKNEEAIFCEDHFLKTHSRDEEGRYVVKMPLKNEPNCLATRGLLATDHVILNHGQVTWTTPELALPSPNYHTTPTGRLIRDPQYLKLYRDFIHEYDQLGHMKEVVAEHDNSEVAYYMPHHGVLRPEKSTTKKSRGSGTIARLFDLLGLLGPVVARAKIFMQSLWSLKINWTNELPSKRVKEWYRFLEDFNSVRSICIDRCIVHPQATRVELHGFVGASEKCYGAVICCCSHSPDGATTVKFVTNKSRVAPVKSVTMPRLELRFAVLLAKLMERVETALQMKTPPVYLWSGSTIVLAWIQKEPNLLKTFVANNVATIQHLTNAEQWHHVSSEENPADIVSRGLDLYSLSNNSLWGNGPTFLATKDFPERNTLS
ncbi:uncharacterized protein TNCV_949661 [Trichonephila clavipes]|nr:uncharacterized protein TNCV_949661 [Trichonephila clavipes]